MASPLIGCKEQELIYINTEKFDLTIIGKPCHPKAEVINRSNYVSHLSVNCNEKYFVDIKLSHKEDINSNNSNSKETEYKTIPLFFENQNYQLIIENKGDKL